MKTKSTKKALLASLLSLAVCVSMLVGSTFAWFTDSVTSANNIIKSGNLDVTLEWMDGTKEVPADPDDAAWKDASTDAIFNYNLWEPGYTTVRHIKIGNEGSLALKYKVVIEANGTVSDLIDVIDVYYFDPAQQIADRTALAGVTPMGTLTTVLGNMSTSAQGELAAGHDDVITIALKMKETAGNEYMNKSVGDSFAIKVFATQLAAEEDSFGSDYDNKAVYDDEVQETAQPWHELDAVQTDTVVDGGGNTYAAEYQEVALVGNADLTIKGVTFQNGLTVYTTYEATGTIRLENCTIYLNTGNGNPSNNTMTQFRADYGLIIGAISPNVTWEFVNCKFKAYDDHTYTNTNSYNAYILGNYSAESITFDGCTFEGSGKHGIGCSYNYGPNQDTIPFTYFNLNVTGCNFVDWNNCATMGGNGAAIRGNVPAEILTQFNKSISISNNTFGDNNGSTQTTVAIDGWNGTWN